MPDILGNPFTQNVADPTGAIGSAFNNSALNPLSVQNYASQLQAQAAGDWLNNTPTSALSSAQPAAQTSPAVNENQYADWWNYPDRAMGSAINSIYGAMGDVNNPFYQQLQSMAPGLKWMDYFNALGAPSATKNWMGDLQGFLGNGAGGNYGLGAMDSALNNLLNVGSITDPTNPFFATIDQYSPEALAQMFGQVVGAGGYGKIPTETMQGIASVLQQLLANYGASGLATGASDITTGGVGWVNYLKNNAPGLLKYLGM